MEERKKERERERERPHGGWGRCAPAG